MKKLTIILLFISIICQGQPQMEFGTFLKTTDAELAPDYGICYKHEKRDVWNEVKVCGIMVSQITLAAASDALYDNGDKVESKLVELASLGILAYGAATFDINKFNWWRYLIKYTAFRIGTYDFTYNAIRGLPLDYIGNTGVWDKARQITSPPLGMQVWGKGIFFIAGATIPIN